MEEYLEESIRLGESCDFGDMRLSWLFVGALATALQENIILARSDHENRIKNDNDDAYDTFVRKKKGSISNYQSAVVSLQVPKKSAKSEYEQSRPYVLASRRTMALKFSSSEESKIFSPVYTHHVDRESAPVVAPASSFMIPTVPQHISNIFESDSQTPKNQYHVIHTDDNSMSAISGSENIFNRVEVTIMQGYSNGKKEKRNDETRIQVHYINDEDLEILKTLKGVQFPTTTPTTSNPTPSTIRLTHKPITPYWPSLPQPTAVYPTAVYSPTAYPTTTHQTTSHPTTAQPTTTHPTTAHPTLFSPTISPSELPIMVSPSFLPSVSPVKPSSPTKQPSTPETSFPTVHPSVMPTSVSGNTPSGPPSSQSLPTKSPSLRPVSFPTAIRSQQPTMLPPSTNPSAQPAEAPSSTKQPSALPITLFPNAQPSIHPKRTSFPTLRPTMQPSVVSTIQPSIPPTSQSPIAETSVPPSSQPSGPSSPTTPPTTTTEMPIADPSILPTSQPSMQPETTDPAVSPQPVSPATSPPTTFLTSLPTAPTTAPMAPSPPTPTGTLPPTPATAPSPTPTRTLPPTQANTPPPSPAPILLPTSSPTTAPTSPPTPALTPAPTLAPIPPPTPAPTTAPTSAPTSAPTNAPTSQPTPARTPPPTPPPTKTPTPPPTQAPTQIPTLTRTGVPTPAPTSAPTPPPTRRPSQRPTRPSTGPPFTLQPVSESRFKIELLNTGTETKYDNIFRESADRWEQIIENKLMPRESPPRGNDWFNGLLSQSASGPVDDVLIGYEFGFLDGRGGLSGLAGPVFVRRESGIPVSTISGYMRFDSEDFGRYDNETVRSIILHEIAHALGFGLFCPIGKCFCSCPGSFEYACEGAQTAFKAIGFEGPLLLESDGGDGVACVHWESSQFDGLSWTELMGPRVRAGVPELITEITIAAMGELGEYQVNLDAADPIPEPSSISPMKYSARPLQSFDRMRVAEHGFMMVDRNRTEHNEQRGDNFSDQGRSSELESLFSTHMNL